MILPQGMTVEDGRLIGEKDKSASQGHGFYRYGVHIDPQMINEYDIIAKLEKWQKTEAFPVIKETSKGEKSFETKDWIRRVEWMDKDAGELEIDVKFELNTKSLTLNDFLKNALNMPSESIWSCGITKKMIKNA